jgi:tRNA pseudouridine38-40 synthase
MAALNSAAAAFLGEHDFLSFAASDPDLATRKQDAAEDSISPTQTSQRQVLVDAAHSRSTIRRIFSSVWEQTTVDGFHLLVYRVRGSGFLHHMVRNLVGTMLDIGRGYMRADEIPAILHASDRAIAGPTAPARGLFLHSVEYK